MCSARTDRLAGLDVLGTLLAAAATGEPPPADGGVEVLPAPLGPARAAVVAFTAHHVIATAVDAAWVTARLAEGDPDDLGAPMKPAFLDALGRAVGAPGGSLDVVLVAPPGGDDDVADRLRPAPPANAHPRVERAHRYRTDVRVYEFDDRAGVLILGRGLSGRWEAAVEVEPAHAGRGLGRALFAAARRLTPGGQPVWAQVAAGHAASLRAVLAAGYRPVGAEVLFVP